MAKRRNTKKKEEKGLAGIESRINLVLNDDSKLFAFIATFFSIVGFFIALLVRRRDHYVMFYAKQSLMIFIVYLISAVAVSIPGFGWIIGPIVYVIAVLLWVLSWFYAIKGEYRNVPIVGKFAKMMKL
ncbi:MAG: hypothetical protein AABW73_00640 [Nanoarchaeota archaeon]